MSKIESHRDLVVWQKAMDLGVLIYKLSAKFPRVETYRLVDQVTRSLASVPANIAEGRGRATKREYAHFLSVAKGSLMQTETYVTFAIRLGYSTDAETQPILALIAEISKMLTVLRSRLLEGGEV
jgi:four helix bundle protein